MSTISLPRLTEDGIPRVVDVPDWISSTLEDFMEWYGAIPHDPAAATRALALALSIMETHLDRELQVKARTETTDASCVVLLRAWPVLYVDEMTAGSAGTVIPPDQYRLDMRRGIITPGGFYWTTSVTYVGGLHPFPADLEMAIWLIAADKYPGVTSAAEAGTGQAVRRVTTPDVGTVEYASSGGAGGRSADMLLGGTLSPAIEAMVARYRAESVVGAG
jgi:hypothetical protein